MITLNTNPEADSTGEYFNITLLRKIELTNKMAERGDAGDNAAGFFNYFKEICNTHEEFCFLVFAFGKFVGKTEAHSFPPS